MSDTKGRTSIEDLESSVAILAKKVDELESREAIRTVLCNYGRAIDRLDYDLLKSLFHEDVLDEHGYFTLTSNTQIADTAIGSGALEAAFDATFYDNGNIIIKVDGDKATSETYFTSTKIMKEPDEQGRKLLRQSGARFLDRFERRQDGVWRIAYRKLIGEWAFFVPLPTKSVGAFKVPHDPATMPPLGVRDRTDPSYSL